MRDIPPGCIAYAYAACLNQELVISFQKFIVSNEAHFILAIEEAIFASNKIRVLQESPQLQRIARGSGAYNSGLQWSRDNDRLWIDGKFIDRAGVCVHFLRRAPLTCMNDRS